MKEILLKVVKHLDLYGENYRKNNWTNEEIANALESVCVVEISKLPKHTSDDLLDEWNIGYNKGCEAMKETYESNI